GRSVNVGGYGYGFNGQERSTELNDNSYGAEFWEYDSRIGRRWNLDPRPIVGLSQYSAFNNNPILNNDILGDSAAPPKPSAFSRKGFVDLAKYKPGSLPEGEGNVLNRLNAAANNYVLAPVSNLVIDAIDEVSNPGWTLTNIKDGIVGGLKSLNNWLYTHPDPVVAVGEVASGTKSYTQQNWNNPDFHVQFATMVWGLFISPGRVPVSGEVSSISVAEEFTFTNKPQVAPLKNMSGSLDEAARLARNQQYGANKNVFRRLPNSAQDVQALTEAQQGMGRNLNLTLKDPRYLGWEKWHHSVGPKGGKSVVHYVRNPITGYTTDFKFK
ncbi:hypothetical protein, partial [Niastella yeongjuensis]